ncbi:hypothetical protein FRB95_006910 [Tulasnella sp. JGI-2019a]|nr:hypothetical protein FRB95_006910 [Tulasnella sp. JGI-2019a]
MFITTNTWSATEQICLVLTVNRDWTRVQFIYTMSFDLIVLCLAFRALLKLPGASSIWNLLFLDGLAYFIIAFTCYLTVTIIAFFPGVNPIVMYMVSDPATIIAATVANRSFVRVITYHENIKALPTSAAMATRVSLVPRGQRQYHGFGQPETGPAVNMDATGVRFHIESLSICLT